MRERKEADYEDDGGFGERISLLCDGICPMAGNGGGAFRQVPGLGELLVRMQADSSLYGWLSQKGLYQYRVRLDPEIWGELQRRYEKDRPELEAPAATAEWTRTSGRSGIISPGRCGNITSGPTRAAEGWFFRERLKEERRKEKGGCLGIFGAFAVVFAVPLIGWYYWF